MPRLECRIARFCRAKRWLSISAVQAAAWTSGVTPAWPVQRCSSGDLAGCAAPVAGNQRRDSDSHAQGLQISETSAGFYCRVLRQASGMHVCCYHDYPIRWSDGAVVGGTRFAISAPAFGDSNMKINAEPAAIKPTSRKPGGKSDAMMAGWSFSRTTISTASAPTATPVASDTCWPTAASAVARLMRAARHLRIGERIDRGELQRAEEAAEHQHRDHDGRTASRRERSRRAAIEQPPRIGVPDQHVAEAEALEHARRGRLHEQRAERRGERDQAGLERREPEADLQQQRQQERHRADADAEHEAADEAGPEGRKLEQAEIEDRRRHPPRIGDIERRSPPRRRPRIATTTGHGTISKPATDSPNVRPATAVPDSSMPTASKRFACFGADVLDVAGHQHDADQPDRHVDQENPVPGA